MKRYKEFFHLIFSFIYTHILENDTEYLSGRMCLTVLIMFPTGYLLIHVSCGQICIKYVTPLFFNTLLLRKNSIFGGGGRIAFCFNSFRAECLV